MSTTDITAIIQQLREWESIAEEAAAEIESLKDTIKKEMNARGVETLECGQFVARFTTVLSNRFDSTSFKREHETMYKQYTKQTVSKRFSISA